MFMTVQLRIWKHLSKYSSKFSSKIKKCYYICPKKLWFGTSHSPFCSCFSRVSKPPQTLDELGESLSLWEQLNADQPNIEAKFSPLYDQFQIMQKYEVAIPEEVQVMLDNMNPEWISFQDTLIDADAMLKKNKVILCFALASHGTVFLSYQVDAVRLCMVVWKAWKYLNSTIVIKDFESA